ncbi:FixH family protein [Tumebacillus sp. DT12]|uniref:FixH family protein n=1 Tax=Tumebacillus lacus TaxID=2995335 RepID=A0ABT3X1K9_9BACL|nr:FixH family protein [Tumebacillus lacus]MCX7569662.1 FixH family protein [Tumebacillus lacus]
MNRTIVYILTLGLAAALTTGCGAQPKDEHMNHKAVQPQKLTITLQTEPEAPRVGEKTELIASVKAGEEPVTDADVELEIWQGDGPHETVQATAAGDGSYKAATQFAKGGRYEVQIHTTTSELHQMPTVTVEVSE